MTPAARDHLWYILVNVSRPAWNTSRLTARLGGRSVKPAPFADRRPTTLDDALPLRVMQATVIAAVHAEILELRRGSA